MRRILIDTNFLMIPYKFKIDIFSEFGRICNFNFRLHIFKQTMEELSNIIEKQSGSDKKAAKFALKLIQMKDIGIINSAAGSADEAMLKHSHKLDVIATQDRILKKKLLAKGMSVIILRQKKYLQLIERVKSSYVC